MRGARGGFGISTSQDHAVISYLAGAITVTPGNQIIAMEIGPDTSAQRQSAASNLRRTSTAQRDATAGRVTSVFDQVVNGIHAPVFAPVRTEKTYGLEQLIRTTRPLDAATVAGKPMTSARKRAWPFSIGRKTESRRGVIGRRDRNRAASGSLPCETNDPSIRIGPG